jgi:hypothetical protein
MQGFPSPGKKNCGKNNPRCEVKMEKTVDPEIKVKKGSQKKKKKGKKRS